MKRLGNRPLTRPLGLALLFSVLASIAVAEVKTGTYTGNGAASRSITGIGFRPDVVILKGNEGSGDTTSTVLVSNTMAVGRAKPLRGDQGLLTNLVLSLDPDGFTVGPDQRVNKNGIAYHWVAFESSAHLKTGTYTGNGSTQAIAGAPFRPDYVVLMEDGGSRAMQHSYQWNESFSFNNDGPYNNVVTGLTPTGFTLGNNNHSNESGRTYHYVAWDERPGEMRVGWYFGDGNDNRSIGVGFQPEYVIVKNIDRGDDPVQRVATMAGDSSVTFKDAFQTNRIQAFQTSGFQVGTDDTVNRSGDAHVYVAFADAAKPGLSAAEGASTITVTAPDYFDLTFSTSAGGGIEQFHDLASGPAVGFDLAGGQTGLFALLFDSLRIGGIFYNSGENDIDSKVDLLEVTETRVKVRQEAFFQKEGDVILLSGVKAFGDYSIYPTGRLALDWERRTTKAVGYDIAQMGVSLHRTASAPLLNWVQQTESGAFPGPATDVFVLGQMDDVTYGTYTDFLSILYRRWTAADATRWFQAPTPEWGVMVWEDANPYALPTVERWDSLLYFKPTDLASNTDPHVLARRNDYQGPDSTPVSIGWGWIENQADSDFFNESEAAYTFDFDPANGLAFTMNGSGTKRFQPFSKIRQWRSLSDPAVVTLAGVPLVNDVDYKADVKPFARAQFTDGLTWHSTLHSPGDVAAPDVGDPASLNGGTTFAPAKYGNGARFSGPGQSVSFPAPGNLRVDRGAIELWYLPDYYYIDGTSHRIWSYFVDAANQFHLTKEAASNDLVFEILRGGTSTRVSINTSNYGWHDFEWVHLRAVWDTSAALADQVRLFVNRVEPPHASPTSAYNAALMPGTGTVYLGGDSTGTLFASGILDEVHVYSNPLATTALARGGLVTSAAEYLASPTQNFSLALSSVDALRRGAYLYFGADSRFRGINVKLATAGSGAVDLAWEYWNGAGWANLESGVGFIDETSHFTRHGSIYWTADPFGWSEVSIDGDLDLYYVRARMNSGSYATLPIEQQVKTDILLFQYCADVTTSSQTFAFGLPPAADVSISSATNQAFPVGAPTPAPAATITITDVYGGSVTAANDLRIRIPAGFPMRWDTAVLNAGLGGSAAAKVLPTLKPYEDLGQTLVLEVIAPFAPGDQLVVSNLRFFGFTNPAPADNLELETANTGFVAAFDDKTIQVTAAGTPNISSFDNQMLTIGQPPTPAETVFITDAIAAAAITAANDIRIHIPVTLPLTWDNVSTVSISGTAAGKVSTAVTYPTARVALINVTANFAPGEFIAISGLRFATPAGPPPPPVTDRLGLEINNFGTIVDSDDKTIMVEAAADVPFFTATSTSLNVKLEWVNPSFGSCINVHILRRDDVFPVDHLDSMAFPVLTRACVAGNKEYFDDSAGLNDGDDYFYAIFVEHATGFTPGKRVKARPFDTSGPVKWAYSTGAASMSPPGLRFSGGSATVYAVSNDSILHSVRGGQTGGDWPAGWTPYALGAPAQSRPPVLGFAVGASANGVALLGSQDGRVYAINAVNGTEEWVRPIGSMVQAGPAGNFRGFDPGALDFVLVGTRNSSSSNSLYALDVNTGTPQWNFDNSVLQNGSGLEIGIISGSASVDYVGKLVYFASRVRSGGSTHTVWCVNFAASPPQLVWSKPIGDVDGSPILFFGVLYVGTNSGEIFALDPLTGAVNWSLPLANGAIKSFVFPHFGTPNLFVATNSRVWSVGSASHAVNPNWPVTTVPSPSTPTVIPGGNVVLVGSSDGMLYQLNTINPATASSVALGDGSAAVGIPTVDILNSMVYVGTDEGVIYGVFIPIP
jgi:outer membrane protein assembly factor BamB